VKTYMMAGPNAYSDLADAVEASPRETAILTYEGGRTATVRLAISRNGGIMELAPRSRNHGVLLDTWKLVSVTLAGQKPPKSGGQEYVNDLINRRNYLRKHGSPGVWPELVREFENMDQGAMGKLVAAESHYDAWGLARELGLPQIETHKTKTLASCKVPKNYQSYITAAMASFLPFNYSVEGKVCGDGQYRAWLSEEFKGCGNGHYWLLISPTHAIFAEDD
jgi:hypothetical protein